MLSILSMISMWRGSSFPSTFTGHFSRASGITVWFVKASVCTARAALIALLQASDRLTSCNLTFNSACSALCLVCSSDAQNLCSHEESPFPHSTTTGSVSETTGVRLLYGYATIIAILEACKAVERIPSG